MPLVFVHGVNTRRTAEYDEATRLRDSFFRQYCLTPIASDPDLADVFNPYWGDHAATFPWNCGFAHDSQPKLEAFGSEGADQLDQGLTAAGAVPTARLSNDVILAVAKRDFPAAVDLLWTAAGATGHLNEDDAKALAAASEPVEAYTAAQGSQVPDWVRRMESDGQFVEQLLDEAEAWAKARNPSIGADSAIESYGVSDVIDWLKSGATNAAERAADASFGGIVEKALPNVLRRFSAFFGDVFEYIKQRNSGSMDIANIVLDDLKQAGARAAAKHECLVCIGHSMGGDILYDLLTDPGIPGVPTCDLFVTVGSQVGLFEELKMFKSSIKAFPPDPKTRVPASRHPRIKHWINAFDRSDPFGYPVTTIFEGATDYVFDTKTSTLSAHGAYFLQPTFHARLRDHVVQSGIQCR